MERNLKKPAHAGFFRLLMRNFFPEHRRCLGVAAIRAEYMSTLSRYALISWNSPRAMKFLSLPPP